LATAITEKLAFIHVPKTGGTWAVEAMKRAGVPLRPIDAPERQGGHFLASEVSANLFTFGFVRNPLTWYVSYWLHRHTFEDWDPTDPLEPYVHEPFENFIEAVIANKAGFLSEVYANFLGRPDSPVSFIGRYESLAADLVTALRLAEQPFDERALNAVPPLNVTGKHKPTYSPPLRRALLKAESEALERFYWLEATAH
jgi:hypothetical protein